jgi:hypothetical protein
MEINGEIFYDRGFDDNGNPVEGFWIHSDLYKASDKELTEDFRQFLHDCLDEWLNKSKGTGAFWVGDPDYFSNWDKE